MMILMKNCVENEAFGGCVMSCACCLFENLAANQERMAEVRERRENATRAAMLARLDV